MKKHTGMVGWGGVGEARVDFQGCRQRVDFPSFQLPFFGGVRVCVWGGIEWGINHVYLYMCKQYIWPRVSTHFANHPWH